MNYLLDTCVISEPTKRLRNESVVQWLAAQEEESLFLSSLTLGELESGAARLPASQNRERLRQWIDADLYARFEGRILSVDAAVAMRWGRVSAACAATGQSLPVVDGLLVATALVHDLTIVTRSIRDLAVGDVGIFDPWTL